MFVIGFILQSLFQTDLLFETHICMKAVLEICFGIGKLWSLLRLILLQQSLSVLSRGFLRVICLEVYRSFVSSSDFFVYHLLFSISKILCSYSSGCEYWNEHLESNNSAASLLAMAAAYLFLCWWICFALNAYHLFLLISSHAYQGTQNIAVWHWVRMYFRMSSSFTRDWPTSFAVFAGILAGYYQVASLEQIIIRQNAPAMEFSMAITPHHFLFYWQPI
jgi:hypothetical protein